MSDLSKIAVVKDLLTHANRQIQEARDILSQITGDTESVPSEKYIQQAANSASGMYLQEGGERVIEGIFNGQEMIDAQGNVYPVPVNYASKSKLVPGDRLKLTITVEGRFLYKQIGPAPRKHLVGPLSLEDGIYKVLANGKAYKVLLASVTYYKAEIGDEVTVVIPEGQESEWAAIDAVLPKYENIVTNDQEK